MNECLGAIMAKYLAGEASPEETAQLTAWIGEDRSHAREFARLTDIDQVVRPPFDPAGISVDIARERTMLLLQGEERRRRRLRFVRGFERAAAVLFCRSSSFRFICSWPGRSLRRPIRPGRP